MKNESEAKAYLPETGGLQSEYEELSGRLRNWSSALAKADAEIDRLRSERFELVAAKIQLSRIEQSRFWRMAALLRSVFRKLVDMKQSLRAMAIKLLIPLVRLVTRVPGLRALARKLLANHTSLKARLSRVAGVSSSSGRLAGAAILYPARSAHSRFALSESENEAYVFLKNCRQTKGKVS